MAQGFTVGEVDNNGDYQPIGMDPLTGEWRRVQPGDKVEQADLTHGPSGDLGWTDEDRIGHMFEQTVRLTPFPT